MSQVAGVPRWIRHEVAGARDAVRTAPRRTVRAEGLLCVLTAAFVLLPLLQVRPDQPVPAVLEGLWATLLVAVRRHRPAFAVLAVSPLLVGHNVWTLAPVVLVVLSATRRIAPPRRAWRTVGATGAAVAVLTVLRAAPRWEGLPTELAGNAVSAVLLLLLPALAGTLLGRRRLLVDVLRERNAYLEQARSLSASAARLEERNRIAGEMHDLLGHRLSLISVHAGALELAAARQAPPLAGQAELLRTTAGTAMEELREILGVLRHADRMNRTDPADTADLADRADRADPANRVDRVGPVDPAGGSGSGRGTREDIAALVTESRRTGGAVELDWSVPDSAVLGDRTRQAIHRVVREGLTNVLKHAYGAPARVVVRSAAGGIEVSVTNGVPRADGRSRGGTRSGLAGLQERVSLLGGAFEAGAGPDGGFRVRAWLPPRSEAPAEAPVGARAEAPAEASAETLTEVLARARPRVSSGTAVVLPPDAARAPLSDEVLTWPRVLGAGCAAVLVVLPTVGFLMFLLLTATLR